MLIRSMQLHREQIAQPVIVGLTFYKQDNRRYDVSNFIKVLEDGLVKSGFLEDDHWIEFSHIRKGEPDKKNPRVEIVVNVP